MSTVKISGRDYQVKVFDLTTADVAISLDGVVKSFVIQSRGSATIQFRRNTADTAYWGIHPGTSLAIDVEMGDIGGAAIIVGYARSSVGTDTLEVLSVT